MGFLLVRIIILIKKKNLTFSLEVIYREDKKSCFPSNTYGHLKNILSLGPCKITSSISQAGEDLWEEPKSFFILDRSSGQSLIEIL